MENTINEQYLEIIKKCKFISKQDEWFVPEYENGDKFNSVCGLFNGLTMETYHGYTGELPREDGETCPFDEFFIYDEFGNEISELTIEEYKNIYGIN